MKKTSLLLLLALVLFLGCKNKKGIPDVSNIKVDIKLERFDKDFFSIDTSRQKPLDDLALKYPGFLSIFVQNILGLDRNYADTGIRRFIQLSRPIYDSVLIVFNNTEPLQKEFRKAFQFVKYYFPQYKVPEIITVVGPIDALAQTTSGYTPDFLGPDFLGISLQFYMGRDFSVYKDSYFIDKVAPAYRSRRFSKEYIVSDAMQLIVDDLFPDNSSTRSLIEQMIEKGKQWWLLDKFLPETPDSLKTGYTTQQLNWCIENEGLIWSYLIRNENINSLEPATIQNYIGEGPFTQGFSQELSPGNLGQWIGWRIVQRFAEKNPDLKPEQIMQTDPKKILEEAKYKPK